MALTLIFNQEALAPPPGTADGVSYGYLSHHMRIDAGIMEIRWQIALLQAAQWHTGYLGNAALRQSGTLSRRWKVGHAP